jgi:hypothetical protein
VPRHCCGCVRHYNTVGLRRLRTGAVGAHPPGGAYTGDGCLEWAPSPGCYSCAANTYMSYMSCMAGLVIVRNPAAPLCRRLPCMSTLQPVAR